MQGTEPSIKAEYLVKRHSEVQANINVYPCREECLQEKWSIGVRRWICSPCLSQLWAKEKTLFTGKRSVFLFFIIISARIGNSDLSKKSGIYTKVIHPVIFPKHVIWIPKRMSKNRVYCIKKIKYFTLKDLQLYKLGDNVNQKREFSYIHQQLFYPLSSSCYLENIPW